MKLSLSMSMLDPFLSVERHSLHLCAIHLGIFCPILDWGAHSWQEMKARICPIISCCVFEITKQLKSNIKIWLNIGHSFHLLQLKNSMFRSLENLLRNFLVFLCSDLNLKENQKISWNYVFSTFPHLMKLKTKNVASTRSFCFSGISWINKTHISFDLVQNIASIVLKDGLLTFVTWNRLSAPFPTVEWNCLYLKTLISALSQAEGKQI